MKKFKKAIQEAYEEILEDEEFQRLEDIKKEVLKQTFKIMSEQNYHTNNIIMQSIKIAQSTAFLIKYYIENSEEQEKIKTELIPKDVYSEFTKIIDPYFDLEEVLKNEFLKERIEEQILDLTLMIREYVNNNQLEKKLKDIKENVIKINNHLKNVDNEELFSIEKMKEHFLLLFKQMINDVKNMETEEAKQKLKQIIYS